MLPIECLPNRRAILKGGVGFVAGLSALSTLSTLSAPPAAAAENAWIIGPQPGYTPEVGTLTSMLAFTRDQVVHNVQGLSQADLDFLLDAKANTIGALLLHLAATETYYGLTTFGGIKWDAIPAESRKNGKCP